MSLFAKFFLLYAMVVHPTICELVFILWLFKDLTSDLCQFLHVSYEHSPALLNGVLHFCRFLVSIVQSCSIEKLPCFDVEVPQNYFSSWRGRYNEYRKEMNVALQKDDESRNDAADDVIKKYKRVSFHLCSLFTFVVKRKITWLKELCDCSYCTK